MDADPKETSLPVSHKTHLPTAAPIYSKPSHPAILPNELHNNYIRLLAIRDWSAARAKCSLRRYS